MTFAQLTDPFEFCDPVLMKIKAWLGANSPGVPTYDFPKIFKKLHEIESIWPRVGGESKISICRSATESYQ